MTLHAEDGEDECHGADATADEVGAAHAGGRRGGNLGTACDLGGGDAGHGSYDEGGGQAAGYLAAGVCDGVAVGDEVIAQGVDAPGVHGHVGH